MIGFKKGNFPVVKADIRCMYVFETQFRLQERSLNITAVANICLGEASNLLHVNLRHKVKFYLRQPGQMFYSNLLFYDPDLPELDISPIEPTDSSWLKKDPPRDPPGDPPGGLPRDPP